MAEPMSGVHGKGDIGTGRMDGTKPVTGFDSKTVMLRAERHDSIELTGVVAAAIPESEIPDSFTVAQRTQTYFGPKLLLDSDAGSYLLTAPGPDMHLLLWKLATKDDSGPQCWIRIAEVKADFQGEPPMYNICSDCGEPIRSAAHERLSLIGSCVGTI